MDRDNISELREYDFNEVKRVTLQLFGPDPMVKEAKDFNELFEVSVDNEQAGLIIEELNR